MSYIPKYILKRMVPADGIKAVKGGIEMNVINVISPISLDEIPENVLEYVDVLIDGKALAKEIKAKCTITVGGKTYNLGNAKDAVGITIPVGDTIKIMAPITTVKKGEEHSVEVVIKTNNPISINVTRTIA